MQRISNRAIVVIAGLVTVIFLLAGSAGVAFYNGWLQVVAAADPANGATAQALPESVVAAAAAPVLDQEDQPRRYLLLGRNHKMKPSCTNRSWKRPIRPSMTHTFKSGRCRPHKWTPKHSRTIAAPSPGTMTAMLSTMSASIAGANEMTTDTAIAKAVNRNKPGRRNMRYANSNSMTQRSAAAPTTKRIASGNLWKSLILTIGLFGTFLGSLVRVRDEQPPNEGPTAVEVRAPVKADPDPVKTVLRVPEGRTPASVRSLPPLPEKPVFQKPVTRMRWS